MTGTSRMVLVFAGISFCVTAAAWYVLLPDRPGFAIEDIFIAALGMAMIVLVVSRTLT